MVFDLEHRDLFPAHERKARVVDPGLICCRHQIVQIVQPSWNHVCIPGFVVVQTDLGNAMAIIGECEASAHILEDLNTGQYTIRDRGRTHLPRRFRF